MNAIGALRVVEPGLQTTVQDFPGRVGYWRVGIPPSGPMDALAFRLANVLVGNPPGTAAIEVQFVGPVLTFETDATIALAGGSATGDYRRGACASLGNLCCARWADLALLSHHQRRASLHCGRRRAAA